MRSLTLTFPVAIAFNGFDAFNSSLDLESEGIALLQLQANLAIPGVGIDRGLARQDLYPCESTATCLHFCELHGDPHVQRTFASRGLVRMPDYNGVPGVSHLAKGGACGIDVQFFNCPIARKSRKGNKWGYDMTQAIAIKSGDDLIQIAYRPFDVSKWRFSELVGLNEAQWVTKINEVCPEVNTAKVVEKFHDDIRFKTALYWEGTAKTPLVGDLDWSATLGGANWRDYIDEARATINQDFHRFYRAYLRDSQGSDKPPGRCEQTLFGEPVFPVVTFNGVEQPDWDTQCLSYKWWESSFTTYAMIYGGQREPAPGRDSQSCGRQTRDIGGGYFQEMLDFSQGKVGRMRITHPEKKWQIAINPTGQIAEPIVPKGQAYTSGGVAATQWKYLDPEIEIELYIAPECMPHENFVDQDTVCGTPMNTPYPTIQIPFEESIFTADVVERMCKTCNWDPGEGKDRVLWRFTTSHAHEDPEVMPKPLESCAIPPADPVPAPPPSPAEICDDSDIPLFDAESACEHLRDHPQPFGECVMDYCGTGGDPDIVAEDEGALDEPEPACVGGECDPKSTCSLSPQASLNNVKHSNLGGLGPDSGDPVLQYENIFPMGDRKIDLIVSDASGTYAASKPNKNGLVDDLGRIAVNTGSSVTLQFTLVDSDDGLPVDVSELAFSVFDLDTGKKGKSAEIVELCDVASTMVTATSELDQAVHHACRKFTATVPGTGADNPSSSSGLTIEQADRSVTFGLTPRSSFLVKFAVGQGWGQRLFLFALHPGVACVGQEE